MCIHVKGGGRETSRLYTILRLMPLFIVFVFIFLTAGASTGYSGAFRVEGTVLHDGKGMQGVFVEFFSTPPDRGTPPVASANSGKDGLFVIDLPSGEYYVTAKKKPGSGNSSGMLYGSSGNLPVPVNGQNATLPPIVLSYSSGSLAGQEGGTPVSGNVLFQGRPVPGAFVFVYPGTMDRGPGYIAKATTSENGGFSISLLPGKYSITIRFSDQAEGLGSIQKGDMRGEFENNPLAVTGGALNVGDIVLRSVDENQWKERRWGSTTSNYTVHGTIVDESGSPVQGVFAFIYSDHRMVGKPDAISAPSGSDGRYVVMITDPGTYYLGARSRFGGPVEPGEFMGAYDNDGIKPFELEPGNRDKSCDIIVREVW